MSRQHRRNGSDMSSSSWIAGTMDVISGFAPRPSTPQRNVPSHPRSAPNSPARHNQTSSSMGIQRVPSHDYPGISRAPSYDAAGIGSGIVGGSCGNSGGYPSITRVPSADAMERSLHNDSGHGTKSTAQIIRDLKASNAHFSAKTAEMEAEFMNEINRVTLSFEEKNRSLETALKEKSAQVASMEARCASTETRMRESSAQVVKLKDDNAFLRHTISDLKSQLVELKDAQENKHDDWGMEKEEMLQEVEHLRTQVETLKRGVMEQAAAEEEGESPSGGATSSSNNSTNSRQVLENFQQLQESQQALSLSTKRLVETQSALANIENTSKQTVKEHARVVQEHAQEMARLKKRHADSQAEWSRTELQLQNKIERLEGGETNPIIRDLHSQLQECDGTIASLKDEVERSSAKIAELQAEVQKTKSEAASREAYRREEAEDLRVMLDAQSEEIDHLKEDLDECQREIFTKEDDLVEAEKELEEQIDRFNELKAEMDAVKAGGGSVGVEGNERVVMLQRDLADARETIDKLEKELDDTTIKHESTVEALRQEIDELVADRDDAESRLTVVQEERDQAREELAISNSMRDRNMVSPSKDPAEGLRSQLEAKSLEYAELEGRVKVMESELQEASDNKAKLEKVQSELAAANKRIKEMSSEVETRSVIDVEEVKKLRATVKELEGQSEVVAKTKKQLLDAQIALVALDNDRKKLSAAYREKHQEIERQQEELEVRTAATEESSTRIAELSNQVDSLEKQLKAKNDEVETAARALPETNGNSGKETEALVKEIESLKQSETELKAALEAIKSEKAEQEHMMKEKLVDRDTTISALVKASVTQDQKLRAVRAEVESLKAGLGTDDASVSSAYSRASRGIGNGDDTGRLRESQRKLKSELEGYKKNLFEAELESQRLRDELEEAKSFGGGTNGDLKKEMEAMVVDHQEKIQERDAAIATLVKQSMAQEAHVVSLENKVNALKSETQMLSPKSQGPTWEELERLQKESEIFAGQIIEQDEEMELLKGQLEGRDSEIASLKRELTELQQKQSASQSDSKEMVRLRAQLDEMQEASRTHMMELRDLRRKLRESKFDADKVADLKIELAQAQVALEEQQSRAVVTERENPTLKVELADARNARERAEKTIVEQLETIRLSQATADALEKQLRDREATIADLKADFSKSKNDALQGLQSEADKLRGELETQTALAAEAQDALAEAKRSLDNSEASKDGERATLENEVEALRSQLKTLEEDRDHIEELKERLARAEEDRESVENSMVDSFERKMSVLKLDKDVTIDQLRKELAEAKGRNVGDMDGLMNRIHQLEMENKGLSEELDAELESKNAQIHALEQTLHAQERLVNNMRAEMDQLQSGMERATMSRRSEIDDMQQEMLESTAKTTRQEREITALKIELEDTKLQQEAKVAKLMEKIAAMESSPLARQVAEQHVDHRLEEVKERLEQMQWRNTSLEQDNSKLRSRLEKAEATSHDIEKEVEDLASMEEEITFLQSRVQELEKERDAANALAAQAVRAASSRPPTESRKNTPKPPTESRKSLAQAESPARRTSSVSGRLRFPKFRRSSKDLSAEEIPPIPGDD